MWNAKLVGLLLISTVGCGQVNRNDAATSGGTGGSSDGAQAGAGDAAGAPSAPAVDITGRWALIGFLDPVGVELTQHGSRLEGRGCLAATPPLEPDDRPGLCGAISGEVDGSSARFSFDFDYAGVGRGFYTATVEVSRDARRMTGIMGGQIDGAPVDPMGRTAWLPAPDGEHRPELDHMRSEPYADRWYQLTLEPTGDAGPYMATKPYLLSFGSQIYAGITGDFGAFWWSEVGERKADQSLEVGPVPATESDLPVALRLVGDGEMLTHVDATLPSGDEFRFVVETSGP